MNLLLSLLDQVATANACGKRRRNRPDLTPHCHQRQKEVLRAACVERFRRVMEGQGRLCSPDLGNRLARSTKSINWSLNHILIPAGLVIKHKEVCVVRTGQHRGNPSFVYEWIDE